MLFAELAVVEPIAGKGLRWPDRDVATKAADIPGNGTSHASRGKRKEVESMKFSRKMQLQLDSKIRHAMATSQLLVIKRSSTTETHPRPEMDKADGNGADHSK